MINFSNKDNEKNELSNYFKLISLLHKERPITYQEQVENIVKRETNNKKRIELINEVDQKMRKEKSKIEKDVIHKDKTIPPSNKKLKQSGFLSYLFFFRKMVINFAERTETLVMSFFGLKKELSSMSEVMIKDLYENTKKYLIAPVNQMVKKGWLSLDITSYNLIVAFNNFLKNFIRAGADLKASNSSSDNLKIVERFLINYLRVVFVREYREIVEESISEFVLTDKRFKTNYKQVRRLVKEFIDIESRSLCFFNVVNAIFINNYNRFIKMIELCRLYGVNDIKHNKYDFSPQIQTEVKDYIKKIEHKYEVAESELFFLKYIEDISFNSEEGNPIVKIFNNIILYDYTDKDTDIDKLKEMKENKIVGGEKVKNLDLNPFSHMKTDLSRYLLKFITGYRIIYKNILTSPLTIEIESDEGIKEEQTTLFQDNPFQAMFQRISEYARELSILGQNEKLIITSTTYLKYNNNKLLESSEAERACGHIQSIVNEIYNIATKLNKAIYKNYKTSSLEAQEKLEAYKQQSEPMKIDTEENELIPFSFDTVIEDRYHYGKKVIDLLNEIMYVTINFVYLARYEPVMERLARKPELIADSEYYVKIKSKIL